MTLKWETTMVMFFPIDCSHGSTRTQTKDQELMSSTCSTKDTQDEYVTVEQTPHQNMQNLYFVGHGNIVHSLMPTNYSLRLQILKYTIGWKNVTEQFKDFVGLLTDNKLMEN